MTRKTPGFGDTLGEWLVAEGLVPDDGAASAIADVPRVRAMLIAAARERRALSYSEALGGLGLRFSRPKMRAFCRTLDRIDEDGAAAGEPGWRCWWSAKATGCPARAGGPEFHSDTAIRTNGPALLQMSWSGGCRRSCSIIGRIGDAVSRSSRYRSPAR